jgi:transposase-like protein
MVMENLTEYASKRGVHVPRDVKEYILKKIKEGGKSVPEVAREHGIGKTAIYNWLRHETSGSGSDPNILRLQKENQLLKQLVAELSLKVREGEKRGW